ncbi:MAG: hypothetical protein WCF67_08850 [Chitinophagaceae bacterium]
MNPSYPAQLIIIIYSFFLFIASTSIYFNNDFYSSIENNYVTLAADHLSSYDENKMKICIADFVMKKIADHNFWMLD